MSRDTSVKGSLKKGMVSTVSMSKAIKILKVLGLQGSRDPGSIVRFKVLGGHPSWASCFKGTNGPYVSGPQGIEGFPLVSRAFKRVGISKIQRFQGSRDEGFQGFKVQGLEGERAPRFS